MARNDWKWLTNAGKAGNDWKLMKMDENGQIRLEGLELAGNGWNGWKWQEMNGNGWKKLGLAGMD